MVSKACVITSWRGYDAATVMRGLFYREHQPAQPYVHCQPTCHVAGDDPKHVRGPEAPYGRPRKR